MRLNALLFEKLSNMQLKTPASLIELVFWVLGFFYKEKIKDCYALNKSGSLITPLLTKSHLTHHRQIEPRQCTENTLKHLSMKHSFYRLERKASEHIAEISVSH